MASTADGMCRPMPSLRRHPGWLRKAVFVSALMLCMPIATFAGDTGHETGAKNRVAVITGYTTGGVEDGISIGLEYEHRFAPNLGAGVLLERTYGDIGALLIGVPLFVHPYKELFLRFAPMLDIDSGEVAVAGRIGIGWEFAIAEHWHLAPECNLDLGRLKRDIFGVYGLSVSHTF